MRKDAAGAARPSAAAPEALQVTVAPGATVTALLYPAAAESEAGVALILGHGAGAGQRSAFMTRCARDLAARGIAVATFDFLYMAERRRVPDRNDRLEACWRAVVAAVRAH